MNICVFGSSSQGTKSVYVDEAYKLGELIAEQGYTCVNGAGKYGVMGGVNNGCFQRGGKILGVIHNIFCVDSSEHPTIKDLVIVGGIDLYERKLQLFDNSDCIMVLPGGVGTFDELWDGISSRSLGMKGMTIKPICVVNINGFYDGSLLQMKRAFEDGILYQDVEEYFHVEDNVTDALQWCVDAVHSSRKIPMDTHVRKVERVLRKSNNLHDHCTDFAVGSAGTAAPASPSTSPSATSDEIKRNNVTTVVLAATAGVLLGMLLSRLSTCTRA